jgi:hypothetical protein
MRTAAFIIMSIALLAMGCANVPKVSYSKSTQILMPDNPLAEQTISDVTIKLGLFDVGREINTEKYIKTIMVYYDPWGEPLGTYPVKKHLNIFSGTLPLSVTIINNTDQILKLEDMRIMYLDPITDNPTEPYMALDLATIASDPTMLAVWRDTNAQIKRLMPMNENYQMQLSAEIINLFKQQKFINTPKREVMPGMQYSGIILLPISREKVTDGRLSFLDVVSKTATPGYATEKVRFDFSVKGIPKYWKQDKTVSPDWVEIPYDEFLIGVQQK